MTNQNITFTMKFDASDLAKLAGQITAALTGGFATLGGNKGGSGGGGGTGTAVTPAAGGNANASQAQATTTTLNKVQSTLSQLIKAFALFEVLKSVWNVMSRNSTVANTYLGAMGKVFGAAIDMLMLPFLPIFNLILVGLGKLVEWLSRDDVQKALGKISAFIIRGLDQIWGTIKSIYDVLKSIYEAVKDPAKKAASVVADTYNKVVPKGIRNGVSSTANGLGSILPGIAISQIGLLVASQLPILNRVASPILGLEGKVAGGAGKGLLGLFKMIHNNGANNNMMNNALAQGGGSLISDSVGGFNLANSILPNASRTNNDTKTIELYHKGHTFQHMLGQQNDLGLKNVVINVYDAHDPKKVAQVVKDELNKLGKKLIGG